MLTSFPFAEFLPGIAIGTAITTAVVVGTYFENRDCAPVDSNDLAALAPAMAQLAIDARDERLVDFDGGGPRIQNRDIKRARQMQATQENNSRLQSEAERQISAMQLTPTQCAQT